MVTDQPTPMAQPPGQGRMILLGIGLAFLLHILQIPLAGGLGFLVSQWKPEIGVVFYGSPLAIGVTQLVYLVPAIVFALMKGKKGLVKGLLIGGALTLLLNGLCFGIIMFGMGGIGR
jgi:hypothetical protein